MDNVWGFGEVDVTNDIHFLVFLVRGNDRTVWREQGCSSIPEQASVSRDCALAKTRLAL